MRIPGPPPVAIACALGLPLVGAAGFVALLAASRSSARDAAAAPPVAAAVDAEGPAATPAPGLLVSVVGAVAHPGMYRLQRGDRVYAAVDAAGGLTAEADPARLPAMAARLRDGEQVKVPALKAGTAQGTPRTATRVPLNEATVDELVTVPGFDADLAAAAVQRRERYGPFTDLKRLQAELGMTAANLKLARPHLRL